MNCFEWKNFSSDFLDETLEESEMERASHHMSTCGTCRERYDRYVLIIDALRNMGGSAPAGENGTGNVLNLFQSNEPKKSKWARTPWFVKSSVEGLGIALLVLAVFALVPRVRDLYERGLERRLDAYDMAELAIDIPTTDPNAPEMKALETCLENPSQCQIEGFAAGSTTAPEQETLDLTDMVPDALGGERPLDEFDRGLLKVGNAEIWRFNIKTDSPKEMRQKVVLALKDLRIAEGDALFGREAPGGVQFTLTVPKKQVPDIKRQMEKLAYSSTYVAKTGNPKTQKPFTWFKNRYRKKMPANHTRVVIWLSQI